jgi:hypothetical protein
MARSSLILAALFVTIGAAPLDAQPTIPRPRPVVDPLLHWYSPRGKKCPWYAFEPGTPGSRADAKAACQKLNGTPCVAHRGTALPVCP